MVHGMRTSWSLKKDQLSIRRGKLTELGTLIDKLIEEFSLKPNFYQFFKNVICLLPKNYLHVVMYPTHSRKKWAFHHMQLEANCNIQNLFFILLHTITLVQYLANAFTVI